MSDDRKHLKKEDIEKGDNNGHDSDIDKWVCSMEKLLVDVPQYMCTPGHPGRISRIPDNIREIDVKCYEPYFLSIGPYHNDKQRVKPMERRKKIILKLFLQAKPELTLKDYLKEIKSIEAEARSFYSDVEMESENFVLMLLLDTIYLLSLFCGIPKSRDRINQTNLRNNEDKFLGMNSVNEGIMFGDDNENMGMIPGEHELDEIAAGEDDAPRMYSSLLTHDLFLLENQLPFFVLQKIHCFAYGLSSTQLICLVKDTIRNVLLDYTKLDSELVLSFTEEAHHLLHICHMFFRPMLQQEAVHLSLHEPCQMFRLGSAVQLYGAGVKFMARSSSRQHSLLDITFNPSGKFVMPCLSVDDNTNSLLRNLIAVEQMKYPNMGLNVSAYIVLLLHLVTTPEDAELLRKKGLIQHHLASDKEMMYLVNKLSVGLSFDYANDNYSLKPVFFGAEAIH